MSSRRSRGRSRYQRRRAHAVLTKGRPGLVATAAALGLDLYPHQEAGLQLALRRTERATCPGCGNQERVKKDGTMGKHTSAYGGTGRRDCSGVGRKPEDD
jgi:hypothetical protein